jgi:hypothetical protein
MSCAVTRCGSIDRASKWLNRPGPVKIVACAAFGACLGWVAGPFEPLAPASALPALASQKALSLALRALIARRRHSSARRRKCSILNCFLPADRPASLLCPVGTQQLYLIFGSRSLKLFARLRAHRAATIPKRIPHESRGRPFVSPDIEGPTPGFFALAAH